MSNYPPGVTESMIPGNRPEDEAWERAYVALIDSLPEQNPLVYDLLGELETEVLEEMLQYEDVFAAWVSQQDLVLNASTDDLEGN